MQSILEFLLLILDFQVSSNSVRSSAYIYPIVSVKEEPPYSVKKKKSVKLRRISW